MFALLHLKRRGALTFIGSFYFASSTVAYPHIKREIANVIKKKIVEWILTCHLQK